MTALAGLVAVLVIVIVVLSTASTDSAIGRTRAHLGDAADAVGDSLTVTSPSPMSTNETNARVAAAATRALLDSALRHLALMTPAGNAAAAKEYDALLAPLALAGPGSDQAFVDALFKDAGRVRASLLVIFPAPTPTP